jgi:hypothetical protein
MKQLLLPLIGASLSLSVQAQTLFSTTFNTQEEFDQWTVINANEDVSVDYWTATINPVTWMFSPTGDSGKRTYYNYHSTNKADDWLISPAITPTEDGQYVVKYTFEGGTTYPEALQMYYGSAPTVEELSKKLAKDYPAVTGQHNDYFFVQGKANVPFYVAFYACSEPDRFRLYAQGLEVKRCDNPVDLAVTEIITPQTGEGLTASEPVKVKIANYGTSEAAAGSYTATVMFDGVAQFTETINQAVPAGEEIEVTLAGVADLSISHRTYSFSVAVTHPEDIMDENNALTVSIKHVGPAVEPYKMGFETTEDTSDLKFFDLNEDSGHWSLNVGSYFLGSVSRTGVVALAYNYDKNNQADDWAILDGIQMKAGYHVIKHWVSTLDDSHTEAYSMYWGNQPTAEAMTNKINEYTLTQAEYKQVINIIHLDEDQTVYIGYHAESEADQNWLCIDDIEVNTISETDVDLAVTGITTPSEYLPTRADHQLTFTAMNQGVADVEGTITIIVDGKKAYESTETFVAQDDHEYTFSNIISKLSVGKHTISINVYNAKDNNADNNALELTFYKLGTADLSWDFEDGVVPEEFTFKKDESNELSSTAIAQYGENGVGIQLIETHKYYGNYMLGFSSWFTSSTAKADRWLILPRVHVDSDDACFVVNTGALSEFCNEQFNICVSKESTSWWDFNDLVNVKSENYVRKNRGILLGADYKDKDVYVAINLKTQNGDALGLDNMELHGCSLSPESAVKDITVVDGASFLFEGDILTFGDADDVRLDVYNVNGSLVYSATGASFNLSELAKGIYIVRATTAKGVATTKIVK